jgi:hypothetical protein
MYTVALLFSLFFRFLNALNSKNSNFFLALFSDTFRKVMEFLLTPLAVER